MAQIFQHPRDQDIFIVFESNGTRTIFRESGSYGLQVYQRLPNGKKGNIGYGNDQAGFDLYIHALRALIANHEKIPAFKKSKNEVPTQFGFPDNLEEGKITWELSKEYPSTHQADMNSYLTVSPFRLGRKIGLQVYFTTDAGKPLQTHPVILSPEVIEAFCKVVPKLYPKNVMFRKIHDYFAKHQSTIPKMKFPKSKVKLPAKKKAKSRKKVMERFESRLRSGYRRFH